MTRTSHLLATTSILPGLTGQFMAPPEGEGEGAGGGGAAPAAPPAAPAAENIPDGSSGGVDRYQPSEEDRLAAEEKAKGEPAPQDKPTERPEGLPEGFDTWEAYGKAQVEAQAKAAAEPAGAETPEAKAAREAFETKAAPYTAELTEKGELSAESITKAAATFGVTEDVVIDYVNMQKAKMAGTDPATLAWTTPFHTLAGGADKYAAFQEWSAAGMTKAEQDALNSALDKEPDPAKAAELAKPFIERWKQDGKANPPGTLTRGAGAPSSEDTSAYGSMEEQLADQRTDLYKSSQKERDRVKAKLARSNF